MCGINRATYPIHTLLSCTHKQTYTLIYTHVLIHTHVYTPIQVFYFKNPVDSSGEMRLHGSVEMIRQDKNKRLYNMRVQHAADDAESITAVYEIP